MTNIKNKDSISYKYPSDEDIHKVGVTGLFLGYYFPWNGISNAIISQSLGFKTYYKLSFYWLYSLIEFSGPKNNTCVYKKISFEKFEKILKKDIIK